MRMKSEGEDENSGFGPEWKIEVAILQNMIKMRGE